MDNEYGIMFKQLMNERNELRKYIIDTCKLLYIDTSQSVLGANCLEFYAVLCSTAENKIRDLQEQLNRKGRECEELKRIKNDFFKHAEVSHEAVLNKNKIIDEQAKELDQLKVENEELKKEINYMEGYIRTVENARDEFAQELKQKERALDEIKKIINIDYYQDSWATLAIKIDNIREIINKIKEIYPYG